MEKVKLDFAERTLNPFNQLSKKVSLLSLALASCLPVYAQADNVVLQTEKKLLSGLHAMQSLSMDDALDDFSTLSDEHPNYKLVQLLKADLLAIKAGKKSLSDGIHRRNPKTTGRLKDEAQVRWQFSQASQLDNFGFENYVLKTAEQSHLMLVSLSESRIYIYQRDESGKMQNVADYYVSMGRKGSGKQKEGDLRTPVGVYHVVDLLPDSDLPDLYGVGALPLNYPNQWDLEHGKTGSGIWLHGTPRDTYIRAPKASRGCVVLNNQAMQTLLAEYKFPFATPVLIVDDREQLLTEPQPKIKELLLTDVKSWLHENYVGVSWDKVSVYRYPNEDNLVYVTFPAEAEGEIIHQYWQLNDDGALKLVKQSQEPVQSKKQA